MTLSHGHAPPDVPLETELAAFYRALSASIATLGGPDPTIAELREAARAARLALTPVLAEPVGREVPGLGMGATLFRSDVMDAGDDFATGLLIYLHGGGWTILDVETHTALMQTYARRSGWAVLGLEYPRAPETRSDAMMAACEEAVTGIRQGAAELGVDPARIILGGDSSGANLALGLMLRNRPLPLAGLLLNYGVYDCDFTRPSYVRFGAPPYLLSPEKMAFFWSNFCETEQDRTRPWTAPLRAGDAMLERLPATFMAVAAQDILHDENIAMAGRLSAAGVAVDCRVYPAAGHGFLEAIGRSPVAARAIDDTVRWLSRIPPGAAHRRMEARP